MKTAVNLQNICFNYRSSENTNQQNTKNLSALNDISISVKKGECILLTGISGCGKTSVLRTINGLIPNYYEGKLLGFIEVSGEPIQGKPIYEISKKASTVFQNPKSQFFNLDTTSEILFFLENMGTPFKHMHERLTFISEFLNIKHLLDRNIFNLSGGEKQMIAIASALAADTDIIVLDEPTSNLDLYYIEKMTEVLTLLKKSGKTLIISEHRLHFLKDLIDRAFLIKDGKVEKEFSQQEFISLSEENRKELLLRPITMDKNVFNGLEDSNYAQIKSENFMTVENLCYRFKKEKDDFLRVQNLKMGFGKVIALTGKNGQGKSTFAQCLTGLLKAKKDSVLLNEKKITAKQRLRLSYMVLQDVGYQLFTESVEDEIALGKNKKIKQEQSPKTENTENGTPSIETILKAMNLTELKDKHPLSLSGGQKQRVSIGAAVSSDSRIIIMDEPTSGMDYFHMKETAKLINSIRSPETLILIISHDFEFLSLVADEIILMEKGEVISHSEFTKEKAEEIFNYLKEHSIK
ncbi:MULTISPECIES: ABC transporter ATP-binding protein [unclassified Treponema]|uniref:ABC transporter ATP-binding protein n=1 Tax=unclassified Treponema TaxID=2638727 RepID=UPI0020A56EED|nr:MULTISPECIES: ABC transporter ATP-binding protein [unclassified Treponema]UTC67323.1 ABC transporter ATP-binding protein [Treponema sp. OMZ 789]UTC70051.1 ABC transporter ATP-binding protein [Treponema sp. OMZ 790]UTC72767.1 ABC transporter ATP-binding protein [Treponema sp. OMZ 791]